MNRALYSCLVRALVPLLAGREYARSRSHALPGARFGERLGHYDAPPPRDWRPVWVHAVSLGETRAAQALVQGLLDRGLPVLLTHMTLTGRREGARLFAGAIERGQLRQSWLPYDLPGACRRFFAAMQPRCGILIEREVWPNLIHAAQNQGVPLALVSARLSERSAGIGRRLGGLLREAYAALDMTLAQTADDARRLAEAGARAVSVCGNLKFDAAVPQEQVERGRAWRRAWNRPVVTLASTREGEEAAFIQALARCPLQAPSREPGQPLLLIVPRHPERFDEVAARLQAAGLNAVRRSQIDPARPLPAGTQALLGDSMGEMVSYYAASDVAIVAGGFVAQGGQNLIEACAAGAPVVVGPHARHFKQATEDAIAAGAAVRTAGAEMALKTAADLLADAPRRAAMSQAGLRYVASHAGAARRALEAVAPVLGS
jgi:3-deoxy-D-manno-octulosonic-acid transferase